MRECEKSMRHVHSINGEIKDEPEEREKCEACGQEIPETKSSDNV